MAQLRRAKMGLGCPVGCRRRRRVRRGDNGRRVGRRRKERGEAEKTERGRGGGPSSFLFLPPSVSVRSAHKSFYFSLFSPFEGPPPLLSSSSSSSVSRLQRKGLLDGAAPTGQKCTKGRRKR